MLSAKSCHKIVQGQFLHRISDRKKNTYQKSHAAFLKAQITEVPGALETFADSPPAGSYASSTYSQ